MPIAKIQLPDGRVAKFEVPEGTTEQQVLQFANQQFSQPQAEKINPTDDMSSGQLLAAGAGKAVADVGRGSKQMLAEKGNRMNLAQALSPQQQMTMQAWGKGDRLQQKVIPDEGLAGINKEIADSRRLDAPLMDTGWGTTGNIGGNVLMTLPALAIPGVNTYTGAAAMGGAVGALQPTTEGESRGVNTLVGAGAGLAGQGIGSAIGKAVNAAKGKVSQIEGAVAEKAAAQAAAETASARSAAGNAAQNAYRQLEHLRELGALRGLTAEEAQIAAQLEQELAEKAAGKLMPAAAEKEATAKAYKEAMDTEADRAAKIAAEKLSGKEAKGQLMARVKRYGPAAVGGMVGNMIFPGLGGSVGGAATGLVLRPALRSMANLLKNPAVQRQMLMPIANSTAAANPNLPLALALMNSSVYAGQQ